MKFVRQGWNRGCKPRDLKAPCSSSVWSCFEWGVSREILGQRLERSITACKSVRSHIKSSRGFQSVRSLQDKFFFSATISDKNTDLSMKPRMDGDMNYTIDHLQVVTKFVFDEPTRLTWKNSEGAFNNPLNVRSSGSGLIPRQVRGNPSLSGEKCGLNNYPLPLEM